MAAIRTVNMLWERKTRGSYPVSRYALDDDCTLAAVMPRPLETRAYDLTRINHDGGEDPRVVFSVETLVKLDVSAYSDEMIGMTSFGLYLFHAGQKKRYLADRHVTFIDAALSADGKKLVAGFSDMAASSFALSYGGIDGTVGWLRELEAPLTAVAISADGSRVAFGADNGQLWLVDSGRRDVWAFEQPEPIRSLACDTQGLFIVYGTATGAVGLVDGFGSRKWEANLPGEIVSLALSDGGEVCAALCRPQPDDGTTQLYCLVGSGSVGWEYAAERRLVSLCLSPNGRWLAISGRDGTHTVYDIVLSEGQGSGSELDDPCAEAERLDHVGDARGACRVLRKAIKDNPADMAVFADLLKRRDLWLEARLSLARKHLDGAEFALAEHECDEMLEDEPQHPIVIGMLASIRNAWGEHLLGDARNHIARGELIFAEAALREAVATAPYAMEIRRELNDLHSRCAAVDDAEAERLLAVGDLESGLAALERAQDAAPTPERSAMMARAHTALEFAVGMSAYNDKRYREAIFQFKKALARDPDHMEAQRYLGFAERFDLDTSTDTLSDRFSRLE